MAHVKEYNQSYNYFAGMSDSAISSYQKDAVLGHRPTWKMGTGKGRVRPDFSTFGTDPFSLFGDGLRAEQQALANLETKLGNARDKMNILAAGTVEPKAIAAYEKQAAAVDDLYSRLDLARAKMADLAAAPEPDEAAIAQAAAQVNTLGMAASAATEKLEAIDFRQCLAMGTINGAKALRLEKVTGSLTPGKRADIILIRGNDINVAPVADIEASVVQSATPANVDTVMVDGRIVKRGGKLVAYDVDKIVREAKASALRIRTAAGGRLAPSAAR